MMGEVLGSTSPQLQLVFTNAPVSPSVIQLMNKKIQPSLDVSTNNPIIPTNTYFNTG